jgi:hypothetical protein
MKTFSEEYEDIIRRWQAGEKTPELAKRFEEISAMFRDSPIPVVDEDLRETVHEINNFIHTENLLKSISKS